MLTHLFALVSRFDYTAPVNEATEVALVVLKAELRRFLWRFASQLGSKDCVLRPGRYDADSRRRLRRGCLILVDRIEPVASCERTRMLQKPAMSGRRAALGCRIMRSRRLRCRRRIVLFSHVSTSESQMII